MVFNFLPKIIQFNNVPDWKYENCPTREEYRIERLGNQKNPPVPTPNDSPVAMLLNKISFLDLSDELFAGDNIVGIFRNNTEMNFCIYKWKRNNSRNIVAYALCQEWEWDSMVEGGVHILKPIPKE